jgi:hypothetical protein
MTAEKKNDKYQQQKEWLIVPSTPLTYRIAEAIYNIEVYGLLIHTLRTVTIASKYEKPDHDL